MIIINNIVYFKTKILRIRKEEDKYITISPYGKIVEINEVGRVILEECKKTDNFEELLKKLSKIYNLNEEYLISDVKDFLDKMSICGIIEFIK